MIYDGEVESYLCLVRHSYLTLEHLHCWMVQIEADCDYFI